MCFSGVQAVEEAAVCSSDTRPSDEEVEETDDDEEWTPGLSGNPVPLSSQCKHSNKYS